MNPYHRFLESLSNNELEQLKSADKCINTNDSDFLLSPKGINVDSHSDDNNSVFISNLMKNQSLILTQLHTIQPLNKKEFNFQAQQLIEKYQPESFCHHEMVTNRRALIINGASLIMIEPEDARHKYGYYCEQQKKLSTTEAKQAVLEWLESGKAYDDYRVKTHCLYICTAG